MRRSGPYQCRGREASGSAWFPDLDLLDLFSLLPGVLLISSKMLSFGVAPKQAHPEIPHLLSSSPRSRAAFVRGRNRDQQARLAFEHLFEPGSTRCPVFRPADARHGSNDQEPSDVALSIFDVRPSFRQSTFCNGTSPSHAAKSRPRWELFISGPTALIAIALTGPIPGAVCRRIASGSRLACS